MGLAGQEGDLTISKLDAAKKECMQNALDARDEDKVSGDTWILMCVQIVDM